LVPPFRSLLPLRFVKGAELPETGEPL
jgi:hypothetical protein